MRIIAIIPARGNSKSLKNKNMLDLNGKPLIYHTIRAAKKSKTLDGFFVSSDNKNILKYARSIKCPTILRPKNISRDNTSTKDVLLHANQYLKKKNIKTDIFVTLQPTSPFRDHFDIDSSVNLFLKKKPDSLVSCVNVPHNYEPSSQYKIINSKFVKDFISSKKRTTRKQNKIKTLARNGAIYITPKKNLKKYVFGGRTAYYMMRFYKSLDIDYLQDYIIAKKIFRLVKNETL
tara:strand:+ start:19597 stop:20295 length:699 start_codon:yes stop_codon:yes gene_type:complete